MVCFFPPELHSCPFSSLSLAFKWMATITTGSHYSIYWVAKERILQASSIYLWTQLELNTKQQISLWEPQKKNFFFFFKFWFRGIKHKTKTHHRSSFAFTCKIAIILFLQKDQWNPLLGFGLNKIFFCIAPRSPPSLPPNFACLFSVLP